MAAQYAKPTGKNPSIRLLQPGARGKPPGYLAVSFLEGGSHPATIKDVSPARKGYSPPIPRALRLATSASGAAIGADAHVADAPRRKYRDALPTTLDCERGGGDKRLIGNFGCNAKCGEE